MSLWSRAATHLQRVYCHEKVMPANWGKIIYWAATLLAGLIIVSVAWSYLYNVEQGEPIIPIVPLLFAGAIWLAGWTCRYLFSER